MNTIQQEINQNICDSMTQLHVDVERALRQIFEQAGTRIKPEQQEAVEKEMESTKQLVERFKSRYAPHSMMLSSHL
ncbi:hypothetical protein H6G89_09465 [Oscillatoria sp. FACHB-1407]|uniref:hypothetical protein n=1 Tax=Oscillatoria sp. FACHB-1407 TaxID=2692847 RepID=UPI00168535B9|nr:hypothetical protein [Oscillatoria sp. FACHB-1407]MBD2461273.1 hypothetical protein [Oscillatoria sp. FACHB-1407]